MAALGRVLFVFKLFTAICIFLTNAGERRVSYKNCRVYEINPITNDHLKVLQTFEYNQEVIFFNPPRNKNYKIGVLVFPDLVAEFENTLEDLDVPYKLVHDDVDKIIKEEQAYLQNGPKPKDLFLAVQAPSMTWDAYFDYDVIVNYLREMEKRFPNEAKVIHGGRTYEGRNITGLKIKRGNNPNQPTVFIESGIHAREWITMASTTYFIEKLLTSEDPEIKKLANKFEWHIFPVTNPDGYHYSFTIDRLWRKTRSRNKCSDFGVDANRNYDFYWNTTGVSPDPQAENFPGCDPFSEIETRTLADYTRHLNNLLAYITFHSTSQVVLVPYSNSKEHFENYDDTVAMGTRAIARAKNVNGVTYMGPVTAAEILYSASGGSMDWVKYTLKVPIALAVELRGTDFHWPPKRIPEQGDEVVQMILGIFEVAEEKGYLNKK